MGGVVRSGPVGCRGHGLLVRSRLPDCAAVVQGSDDGGPSGLGQSPRGVPARFTHWPRAIAAFQLRARLLVQRQLHRVRPCHPDRPPPLCPADWSGSRRTPAGAGGMGIKLTNPTESMQYHLRHRLTCHVRSLTLAAGGRCPRALSYQVRLHHWGIARRAGPAAAPSALRRTSCIPVASSSTSQAATATRTTSCPAGPAQYHPKKPSTALAASVSTTQLMHKHLQRSDTVQH